MIIAGQVKDLMGAVHLAADGSQVDSGTIYCVVRLESNDGDDGKFWDSNDDTWQASPVAWPTGTHTQAGQWVFALPAAATSGKAGDYIHYTFTDNLTEASATTVCGGGEHVVAAEDPLTTSDLSTIESNIRGADSDDLKDISDQIDALTTSGAFQVTIHVQDDSAIAVPFAQISIYDEANTAFLTRGIADSNGDLVVALDAGTYKLRIFKGLYGFTVPETIIVTGTQTHTITGTAFVAPTPSASEYCVVYGTIRDVAGLPVVGAEVNAYAMTPQVVSGIQKGKPLATTVTDTVGYFQIELVRNTSVALEIAKANLSFVKTVPDVANQDITTWI